MEAMDELTTSISQLCARIKVEGSDNWWLAEGVNDAFEAAGFHLIPRHFYSPIPDPIVTESYNPSEKIYSLEKVNFDENKFSGFAECLRPYAKELVSISDEEGAGFHWRNQFFGDTDAIVLYCLVRHLLPNKVVEVGSGYSSHLIADAIQRNEKGSLTCIEPHPTVKLKELGDVINLVQMPVQKVDLEYFRSLQAGDIVFTDSSHISATGSDVNHEVFQILPALRPGVYVHFHDIWLPFEYPKQWLQRRRWYWNEQYLLYAFLLQNDAYEVIYPGRYLVETKNALLSSVVYEAGRRDLTGSSFWLVRR